MLLPTPFLIGLALTSCTIEADSSGDTGTAPDMSERLATEQVRAGIVRYPADLFGGISAEGAPGDFKIYNDRVRFIIEAVGDSNYYMDYGGSLIDADIVRPEGQPGRDLLDELAPMVSLARIVDATAVTVLSDGADGAATIRVEGRGAPMRLATGAVENPDLVSDIPLRIVTDYTLLPGEYSLTATTTVYNDDTRDFIATIGLFGIVAQEVASFWRPGTGFDDTDSRDHAMQALVGNRNEGVVALMAGKGLLSTNALGEVVSGLAAGITAFAPSETIAPGGSASWTSIIGVAPDLASLETERQIREGQAGAQVTGTVSDASGVGIPGARVTLLDSEGLPLTVANTNAAGEWTAPSAGADSYAASGRGTAEIIDLPAGHGNVSPYDRSGDEVLRSLTVGATPVPFAEGFGATAGTGTDFSLTPPATLAISIADGGPAMVTVDFVEADPAAESGAVYPDRPSGHESVGYVRDGTLEMPVEPGIYTVTASRGTRYEVAKTTVTVASGDSLSVPLDVSAAYALSGVLTLDPHMHASPSGDGGVSMENRLIGAAANGIQVHFGTDHDHVADYNPTLDAIGLGGWLYSVVADEVSPVLRGHFNAYPARQTGAANGSAPRWWQGVDSTSALFASIRRIIGDDGIIQANHPVGSSGMFTRAGYTIADGTVTDAGRWSDDFDAMELLNSGSHGDYFPYYADLVSRGKVLTPVGVSDSHTIRSGEPGANLTFLNAGVALADFSPEVLIAAMATRQTVVSHGPFIRATYAGNWAPGTVVGGGTLEVAVLAPSWIPVQEVALWRDGVVVESATCTGAAPEWCTATFALPTDADASYIVTAESTTAPMTEVWPGDLAWAATSAIFVDATGNGWTPPKAALIIEE